jgi:hypothetical protein
VSNALAKIKSSDVARIDPMVTQGEAEAAAIKAGIAIHNLEKVAGKKIVGKYLADEIYGHIITDAHLDRQNLNELQELVSNIAKESNNPEILIMAVETVSKLVGKKVELSTLQLKAVEIGAFGRKKKKGHNVGPDIDTDAEVIQD